MTAKQIINLLEKKFVENHNLMDRNNDVHNYEEVRYHSTICCVIAEILSEINVSSQGHEIERLYIKFNLFKGE